MTDNIYTKIMKIRKEFTETEIKKSGHNTFKHFRYLELSDFVPLATKLCYEHGLYTHIDIDHKIAVMQIINTENPEERVKYRLHLPKLTQIQYNNQLKDMTPITATQQIQDTGKLETYARRYLYMLFLDLAVHDTVNAGKSPTQKPQPPKRTTPPKTPVKQVPKKKDYEEQVVEPRHRPRSDANTDMQIPDPKPLKTLANQCIQQLQREGKEVTKPNMKVKATIAKRDGRLDAQTHSKLIKYIDEYCPEELE